MPPGGLHIRWPDRRWSRSAPLDHKWYAALAYVRANKLNHNVIRARNDRFGIIASGKAYNDTRQALADLGWTTTPAAAGHPLHKVGVVWPLEATITREFATGLQEILVVEESARSSNTSSGRAVQLAPDVRPNVLGKFDEPEGDLRRRMVHAQPERELAAARQGRPVAGDHRQGHRQAPEEAGVSRRTATRRARMDARLDVIAQRERAMAALKTDTGDRTPWFCSGCPHNTSTRVPEGSRAMAGIGCHFMSVWMDRSTSHLQPDGRRGWPGSARRRSRSDAHVRQPRRRHLLPQRPAGVRQSIAAGVNITYKILYNDAVAMTGGQQVGERPEGCQRAADRRRAAPKA